jgi:hypothetical protein
VACFERYLPKLIELKDQKEEGGTGMTVTQTKVKGKEK